MRIWTRHLSKKIYKCPTSTREDAQHSQPPGSANQNHEIPLYIHYNGYSQKSDSKKCCKDLGKLKLSVTTSGCENWCRHWNTVWQFLQRLNRIAIWPRSCTPGHTPKRNSNSHLAKLAHTCLSQLIQNSQKVTTTQTSTSRRIGKQNMEYPHDAMLWGN